MRARSTTSGRRWASRRSRSSAICSTATRRTAQRANDCVRGGLRARRRRRRRRPDARGDAASVRRAARDRDASVCLTTGFAPPTRDRILDALGWHDARRPRALARRRGRGRPSPDMILDRGAPPRDRRRRRRRDRGRHRQRPSRGHARRRGRRRRSAHRCARPSDTRDRAAHPHPRLDRRSASGFAQPEPRDRPGILGPHARNGSRPGRQPVQATGLRVPVGRDLRRIPLDLRLRPARRARCCAT